MSDTKLQHKANCAALPCEGIAYRMEYVRRCATHGERPFPEKEFCSGHGECDCGALQAALQAVADAARTVREFQTDHDSLADQQTDRELRGERELAEGRLDAMLARLEAK